MSEMTTPPESELEETMREELIPIEDQKPMSMMFSNRTYDLLKYVAQILLPALAALYFGLAQIWHLPNADEVVGSITVIDTFLGTVLLMSARSYDRSDAKYDGIVQVQETDDMTRKMSLQLNATPDDLVTKKDMSLKVVKQ